MAKKKVKAFTVDEQTYDSLVAMRDGQVLSDNSQQVLSGSPLMFIPPLLPLAAYSSKPHPGSCRQDPDEAAACYIDQRTL